jgi:SAM-dependent methyltransferase
MAEPTPSPAPVTQLEYWNAAAGERWAKNQAVIDRNLASITELLFAAAAPTIGEHVIDLGCGCGTTALHARDLVGDAGKVAGIDISAPQLGVARERSLAAGKQIEWVRADAATAVFAGDADLVMSRFGVMFFDDPVAAFKNIYTALAPGHTSRLVFACWAPPGDNAWWTIPLSAADGLGLSDASLPTEGTAPGPFAFSDRDRVHDILTLAGFSDIRVDPRDSTMNLGGTLAEACDEAMELGPLVRLTAGLDPDTTARIRGRLPTLLEPYMQPGGCLLPARIFLVSARR